MNKLSTDLHYRSPFCYWLLLVSVDSILLVDHFFEQDKALAALAIEDKKRQFAAAEKYLEEVLQSALETSDE